MAINKITSDQMRKSAQDIDTLEDRLQQAIVAIDTIVEKIDTMWDGPASERFKERWAEDKVKYTNLCTLMTKYQVYLEDAARAYDEAENAIWQQVDDH